MTSGTLWERIKQGLLEGASSAAETAGYLGRLGKARLDIATTRHAIHEAFAELGGAVYASVQAGSTDDLAGSDAVQKEVADIRKLEAQLQIQESLLDSLTSPDPLQADEHPGDAGNAAP